MPGQAIGKTLNLGYPGTVSQSSDDVIVNRISAGDITFGVAVAIKPDNTVAAFGAADIEDRHIGFAVRTVKQATDIYAPAGAYKKGDPTDVLVRGNIIVPFTGVGTPTARGQAYIRVTENIAIPEAKIGDIEAQADGANTLLLNNVRFTTGRTDATGVVEVTVNERRI